MLENLGLHWTYVSRQRIAVINERLMFSNQLSFKFGVLLQIEQTETWTASKIFLSALVWAVSLWLLIMAAYEKKK